MYDKVRLYHTSTDMSNKKEISIDSLEDITGGSGQQRDEILSFIKK